MPSIHCRLLMFAWTICLLASAGTQARDVVYPDTHEFDHRNQYPLKLLQRALSLQDKPFRLVPGPKGMLGKRSLHSIAQGRGLDVAWNMTTPEREQVLRAIRIPIHKGLIGWRLALIHSERKDRFIEAVQRQQLKQHPLVQVHDWPDNLILRDNQFRVESTNSYRGAFHMLVSGRVDYFPRSVVEIWEELDAHFEQGVEVDRLVLIRYPAAFYYFVNNKDEELATGIRLGLEQMIANGEFDQFFWQFHRSRLERAKLQGRRVINLTNPLLPEATPLARKELWLSLEEAIGLSGVTP
ncbi:transporter substrate-binding domain-containing protein [Pseudomaricurvus alkylphenolicus]|uniref:transporter substrate-binding domain-containing protein n=1 Tax=Pseudomaricurvus alkylphenolicus TaxID=1306991 RepID=UPI00141EAF60|nr:transporter substrate-binding domain-containing protein [Pseudomaricurvus alkylphenolicus]NIB42644.1 transporter substrate-binding domain-containing protein [Pseudomaricurvus alkylphenolicus]